MADGNSCVVRDDLVDRLDNAIRAYAEVIVAMKGLHGSALTDARDAAKKARGIGYGCHADLKAHDKDHGCVTAD